MGRPERPALDRLIYVDDSGHAAAGLAVYGWAECAPDRWADVLATWLATRKKLWREFAVPVTKELHATDYVNGRGRVSTNPPERYARSGGVLWKDLGRDLALECLDTLRCLEGLSVGAVWRVGDPGELSRTRKETYAALVGRFESELAASDSLALMFMDGDGSDASYRAVHRNLALRERRIIEDAIHLDSRHSQLVQMADLIAWCAYVHVNRYDGHAFAHDWYRCYLGERDLMREPQRI